MNLDCINGFLESIALLNFGSNHGVEYSLELISEENNLKKSLDEYFSVFYTSNTPKQPAEKWEIRIVQLEENWQKQLSKVFNRWFFEDQFSPKISDSWSQDNFIEVFMNHLNKIVGEVAVFEVFVNPPMFYECYWQDFVFQSKDQIWLLHLGVSD